MHYVKIRGSVISVRERKFQRTKVPEDERSTYRTFVPGNESSRVRKFHESSSRDLTWPQCALFLGLTLTTAGFVKKHRRTWECSACSQSIVIT